jgi:hypothetical protein
MGQCQSQQATLLQSTFLYPNYFKIYFTLINLSSFEWRLRTVRHKNSRHVFCFSVKITCLAHEQISFIYFSWEQCVNDNSYYVIFIYWESPSIYLHEDVWGSGWINPRILDLGTSWRLVVSFTPRPLYIPYTLYSRLGEPQNRSGRRGGEKFYPYRDLNSELSAVQPVISRYTDCAIPAP